MTNSIKGFGERNQSTQHEQNDNLTKMTILLHQAARVRTTVE